MLKYISLFVLLFSINASSQELLADVIVDYSQVQQSSTTVYKSLEKSLRDFINTTKWTDRTYKVYEKIECTFSIVINKTEGSNRFNASILVQSRRPVYNSTYYSPILNFNDSKFDFEYTEFEQLIFNSRKFSGKNLTDVIGYYVYLIIGYDSDTFTKNGGTTYFETAQEIANNAQGSQFGGWSELDGPRSRLSLINTILGPKNTTLRNLYYDYHRRGLDTMQSNETNAKNVIVESINSLEIYDKQNNFAQNYPLDIFFLAKKAEIVNIFSGGLPTNANISKMKQLLNTISPTNSALWAKIKN